MLGTSAFLYLLECMKKFEGNFQLESMKLEKKNEVESHAGFDRNEKFEKDQSVYDMYLFILKTCPLEDTRDINYVSNGHLKHKQKY